jgi:hypothetical protein
MFEERKAHFYISIKHFVMLCGEIIHDERISKPSDKLTINDETTHSHH